MPTTGQPCRYVCRRPRSCEIRCDDPRIKGDWTVAPETYGAIMRDVTKTKNERAGTLTLGPGRTLVLAAPMVEGDRDSVDVPKGMLEFHTHPSTCRDDDPDCGIDVPSPEDIGLLLHGLLNGSLAHLVFASTGSYVMQATPSLAHKIHALGDGYIGSLIADFERLFDEEPQRLGKLGNRAFLDRFREAWMRLAKKHRLRCAFQPAPRPPRVRL